MNTIYILHTGFLHQLIALISLTCILYIVALYQKKHSITKYIKYNEIHNSLLFIGYIVSIPVILMGCLTNIIPADIIAMGCIGGYWYFNKFAYRVQKKKLYLIYIITMLMLCFVLGVGLYV